MCDNPNFDDYMLLCDICDDGYHTFCLVKPLIYFDYLFYQSEPLKEIPSEDIEWYCSPCKNKMEEIEIKRRKE